MSDNDSRDGTPVNFLRSRLAALERSRDTPDGSIASRESTPGPSPIPSRLSRCDFNKEDSSRASTPTSDVSSPRKQSPRKGSRSRSRKGGRSRSRRKAARKVILDEDDNSSTFVDHPDVEGSMASNDVSMDATNSLPNGDDNSVMDNQDNESEKSSLSGIAELSADKTVDCEKTEKQNQTEINDSINDCDSSAKPSGSVSPESKSNPRSPVSTLSNNGEQNESVSRSPVRSRSSLSDTSAKSEFSAICKTETKLGIDNDNRSESMNISRPESPMDTSEQTVDNDKTESPPERGSQLDNNGTRNGVDSRGNDSHEMSSPGRVSPLSVSSGNNMSNPQILQSAQVSESESVSEQSLPFDTYGLDGEKISPKRDLESPASVASQKSGLSQDGLKGNVEEKQNPESPKPEKSMEVDGDDSIVSSRNPTPTPDDKDNPDDSASTSPYSGSDDETKREEDSNVTKMENESLETKADIKEEPLSDVEMDGNKRDQNGNRMGEEIKKEIKEEGDEGEKGGEVKQEGAECGEVKTETEEIKKEGEEEERIKKEAEESEDEQPEITVSRKSVNLFGNIDVCFGF